MTTHEIPWRDGIRQLAVIGHPVAHSRSPAIHASFGAATGRNVDYRRLEAPPDGFEATLRAFAESGFDGQGPAWGCNVTVPFKTQAWSACTRLTERARRARAVNTIRFLSAGADDGSGWLGDNTDGAGLVRDIECNAGVRLAGARVLLLGAGGAAAGAMEALLQAHPARIVIANRTRPRALELVERFDDLAQKAGVTLAEAPLQVPGEHHDVLVNATSASLQATLPPLPPGTLRPGALALDMMYGPAARLFLEWARAQGAVARDGLGMLVEQAAEAWVTWFGQRPETSATLAALRREVDAARPEAGA